MEAFNFGDVSSINLFFLLWIVFLVLYLLNCKEWMGVFVWFWVSHVGVQLCPHHSFQRLPFLHWIAFTHLLKVSCPGLLWWYSEWESACQCRGHRFDPWSGKIPEKAMAPHSSTLAWKIPWTEGPGGLQSMGSLRVGHDWSTSLWLFTFMHWRRKWQPTPVFLPGESQGQRSLVGCCLWGLTESDTTEVT